jgi:hypothetical protein
VAKIVGAERYIRICLNDDKKLIFRLPGNALRGVPIPMNARWYDFFTSYLVRTDEGTHFYTGRGPLYERETYCIGRICTREELLQADDLPDSERPTVATSDCQKWVRFFVGGARELSPFDVVVTPEELRQIVRR